jgi:predicted polyphosphate/ATP-dependent NAD kinase
VIQQVGRDNIIVIATKHKLRGLNHLRVDTGDTTLDDVLRGYMRVVVDYNEIHVIPVA